jgi:hypothetical protein
VNAEDGRANGRLPNTTTNAKRIALASVGGGRAWAHEVAAMSDEELNLVVRGMVAVERAVDGYRRPA